MTATQLMAHKGDPFVDPAPQVLLGAIEESLLRNDVTAALGLVRSLRRGAEAPVALDDLSTCMLTTREKAALALLPDAALSQKDMARVLGISRNTLKTHLRSLYQKLGVHSRAEAIEWRSHQTSTQAGARHLRAV